MSKHFDILGQWEEGPWGAATFDLNFFGASHPLTRAEWPVGEYAGLVDVVYANPPCAPWSAMQGLQPAASKSNRAGVLDPRLQFTTNVVDTALELRPRMFILESVCQAWSKGRAFYEGIIQRFQADGYGVTILLTDAILHGALQHRRRFHLIAHRHVLTIPEPDVIGMRLPSVGQTIGDLEDTAVWLGEEPKVPNHAVQRPSDKELAVMERLGPGQGWNAVAIALRDAGADIRMGLWSYHRQDSTRPSRTVVGADQIVHYRQHRFITIREAARLCGYPDDFVFADNRNRLFGVRHQDVTQAVLPSMGKYLGGLCVRSLDAPPIGGVGDVRVLDFRPLVKKLG